MISWRRNCWILGFVLVGWLGASTAACAANYHLLQRVRVGGEGMWDYITVDSEARRLYVTRGTHVMVLTLDSLKSVGDIPETPGVHGVAIARDLGRGFTSNGRDSSVTVFDLGSLKKLARIHVGVRPDAICYDPATARVFTMNAGSHDATAIDVVKGRVAGTVPLAGQPEFAVADGQGLMYVNIEDSSLVRVIDTRRLTVLHTWYLAPGERPTGLALDGAHGRLFSGCANQKLVVLSTTDGHVVATLPIGRGVDATAYEPITDLAFSSNGEGTLTVIGDQDGRLQVVQTVSTAPGARTMALDPVTRHVYTVTAQFEPAPAPDQPHPRRTMVPGTFEVLVLGEQ